MNYETASQHPIDPIDSQRHHTCNSESDCVDRIYYMCVIALFQFFLLQYKHMYTKYCASKKCH